MRAGEAAGLLLLIGVVAWTAIAFVVGFFVGVLLS